MSETKIRHASTVVLLREATAGGGAEIFMVKRHGRSGFMANAYVYPGGTLDDRDTTAETAACCHGLSKEEAVAALAPEGARSKGDAPLATGAAVGLHVAAVREMFEEAGVLLARRTGESDVIDFGAGGDEMRQRFTGYREALHSGDLSMTELAARESLSYALDALHYFAHWITPEVESRRFNTRFFLARAPSGQKPLHDKKETVESQWVSASAALDLYGAGEIQLAPPTMRTLEDMAAFDTVDALIEGMTAHPVTTILPRFEHIEGVLTLLMPGDSRYPSEAPVRGPTRVQLDQGRWWSRKG